MEHPDIRGVDRLTRGQADCLRLVAQHLSSKEIAVRLKISPHTVDQRIRIALQTLGVNRRGQAARMIVEGDSRSGPYQHLIYQSPHLADHGSTVQQDEAISHQIRHADRAGGIGHTDFETEQKLLARSPLVLPFATKTHPSNAMGAVQKLAWIVVIAMGVTFSAGMFLAGLESLSRMIR